MTSSSKLFESCLFVARCVNVSLGAFGGLGVMLDQLSFILANEGMAHSLDWLHGLNGY